MIERYFGMSKAHILLTAAGRPVRRMEFHSGQLDTETTITHCNGDLARLHELRSLPSSVV